MAATFSPLPPDGGERKRVALALGHYDYRINVGIARFAREHHWLVDNLISEEHYSRPERYDGIICLLNHHPAPGLMEFIRAARLPVVDLVDEQKSLALPRVIYDNVAIGRLAASHFLERGFERFIYYQMSNAAVERDRRAGFEARIREAGFEVTVYDLNESGIDYRTREKRIEWLKAQLAALVFPVAAMTQCDANTQEVLMACEELGILLPDQLAAAGVDNDLISSELGVKPLTSIDNNRDLLGFRAAQLLQTMMEGAPPPPEPIRIPPREIVIRESSDILAVANPKAAQALRFIWKNFRSDINSGTVAQAVGLSRRGLFNLFEKYLQRSIAREIAKCRIAEALRLLRETDMTVDEVAFSSGFKHAEHLARVFRDRFQRRPSDFRKPGNR